VDLIQFIRLLRARRRLFWSVFGSIVGVAIALTFILPKTYFGEAAVIVDSKISDPVTGLVIPQQLESTNIATQIDVISSHNVALKVVDKLKLALIPEVKERFIEDTDGEGSIRDWLAEGLLRRLEVKPARLSNLVIIRFKANDPVFAATVANAFSDAYIQTSMELTADPARRQAAWFETQLAQLRESVDMAQRRLSEYQRKQNMIGMTEDHLDVENAKLAELTTQLVSAQSLMYDTRTRLKQMDAALEKGQLEELPDILGNPVLQSMKVDLVRAQGSLAQTAQRFDRNHPQYISAAAQVTALQSKMAAEIQTAKGSISQTAEIAEKRAAQLQGAVDQQKKRILDMKRRHDELDVLNQEVLAAQHAYDTASQRASEVRLQGHLDQSNIAVLNPAIPPLKPARPSLKINLAIGLVLGMMFAMGTVLVAELRNRRIRTEEDVTQYSGLVVLAELPRLAKRTRRRRLHKSTLPNNKSDDTSVNKIGFAGSSPS
jgi:protein tyrosine kinase modulator